MLSSLRLAVLARTLCTTALLAGAGAAPAHAQNSRAGLMTAEQFDRHTRGRTLFYHRNGRTYGAEVYHDDRRVQWSFLDGQCKEGRWYAEDGLICFVYEDTPEPQCWSFRQGAGGGLIARFENDPLTTELYEAQEGGDMLCLGPKVGV